MNATQGAADRAMANLRALRKAAAEAGLAHGDALRALVAAPKSGHLQDRRDAELEVARLEEALESVSESATTTVPSSDRPAVKAAHVVSKAAMDSAGETPFKALDAEVLVLARRFGMVGLENVEIDAQAHMALRKGGVDTKFTAVTKGERLRLRLATAISLLKVGKRLGVGRHPGFLIVDSPGADETDDTNLEAVLIELRNVAQDEVGLQVFVSSAKATKVVSVLAPGKCRVAEEGQHL